MNILKREGQKCLGLLNGKVKNFENFCHVGWNHVETKFNRHRYEDKNFI